MRVNVAIDMEDAHLNMKIALELFHPCLHGNPLTHIFKSQIYQFKVISCYFLLCICSLQLPHWVLFSDVRKLQFQQGKYSSTCAQ